MQGASSQGVLVLQPRSFVVLLGVVWPLRAGTLGPREVMIVTITATSYPDHLHVGGRTYTLSFNPPTSL